jgi:hypothetical protein
MLMFSPMWSSALKICVLLVSVRPGTSLAPANFIDEVTTSRLQTTVVAKLYIRSGIIMAPMSEEDLKWFKSTFRPIPRPQLPDDAIEYSLYLISSSPTPASADAVALARARLQEVQKTASELVKDLLKNYIWQREAFGLQITKEDGKPILLSPAEFFFRSVSR